MHFLFLDTTNGLTIGLLNPELNWLSYEKREEKKPSEVIHTLIDEQIKKYNLNFNQLTLITIAGPGSYTGMRLSEGIAHMLKVCGVKVISFFHFEVPFLSGQLNGKWISPAFKGEFFIYSWDKEVASKELMKESEVKFPESFFSNQVFKKEYQIIDTSEVIHNNQKIVFENVIKRDKFFPSYYFRSLEEEFKQND